MARFLKKWFVMFLVILILLTATPFSHYVATAEYFNQFVSKFNLTPEDESFHIVDGVTTEIKNVSYSLSQVPGETLTETADICNAPGQNLIIEFYDFNLQQWIKASEAKVSGEKIADNITRMDVVFPKQWESYEQSYWRYVLESTNGTELYSSSAITVSRLNPSAITSVETERWIHSGAELIDTINIENPQNGELHVQMYDFSKDQWITEKVYPLNTSEDCEQNIQFPDQWKTVKASKWRFAVYGKDNAITAKSPTITVVTYNLETLDLTAKSAIVYELDSSRAYYSKDMYIARPNASTTKLLTALIASEELKSDEKVIISENAAETPYAVQTYIPGDAYYARDLIAAMLLESDNCAAVALAEHISGSVENFATRMNLKAEELGCVTTNFQNPHGLDEKNHYSTASDLAIIAAAANNDTLISFMAKKKTHSYTSVKYNIKHTLKNNNKLLGTEGVTGLKTGYTEDAGYCFVGTYEYGGKTYVTVVLGSTSEKDKWNDTKKLFKYIREYL